MLRGLRGKIAGQISKWWSRHSDQISPTAQFFPINTLLDRSCAQWVFITGGCSHGSLALSQTKHLSGEQPCLVSGICMYHCGGHFSEAIFTSPFIYFSTSQQMLKCLLCASCLARFSEYSCEPDRHSPFLETKSGPPGMVGLMQLKK